MRRLFILCLLFFITGCIGVFDYEFDRKVTGNFYLSAIDTREDMNLSYKIHDGGFLQVAPPTVFAAGFNDKYIVVKSHPHNFGQTVKNGNTDYYIIPALVKNPYWVAETAVGPLTLEEYEQKKRDLKVGEISFDIVFKDLE